MGTILCFDTLSISQQIIRHHDNADNIIPLSHPTVFLVEYSHSCSLFIMNNVLHHHIEYIKINYIRLREVSSISIISHAYAICVG